jgi:hypothetical protein
MNGDTNCADRSSLRLVQLDTLIEQIEFSLQRGTSAAVATAPLRGIASVSRIQ